MAPGTSPRTAEVTRTTRETEIQVQVDLDPAPGARRLQVDTSLPILDHFVGALTQYSKMTWEIRAQGDLHVDPHHLVEDVGIVMGQAISQALGERMGIQRYASPTVPMDEALVLLALDFSGRGRFYWDAATFPDRAINQVSPEVWPEFFHGFAAHAGTTLHLQRWSGYNAHHIWEASYKALGLALFQATRREGSEIPSTKGTLHG